MEHWSMQNVALNVNFPTVLVSCRYDAARRFGERCKKCKNLEILREKYKFSAIWHPQLWRPISRKRCVVAPQKCSWYFDYKYNKESFRLGSKSLRWSICERQLKTWNENFRPVPKVRRFWELENCSCSRGHQILVPNTRDMAVIWACRYIQALYIDIKISAVRSPRAE